MKTSDKCFLVAAFSAGIAFSVVISPKIFEVWEFLQEHKRRFMAGEVEAIISVAFAVFFFIALLFGFAGLNFHEVEEKAHGISDQPELENKLTPNDTK